MSFLSVERSPTAAKSQFRPWTATANGGVLCQWKPAKIIPVSQKNKIPTTGPSKRSDHKTMISIEVYLLFRKGLLTIYRNWSQTCGWSQSAETVMASAEKSPALHRTKKSAVCRVVYIYIGIYIYIYIYMYTKEKSPVSLRSRWKKEHSSYRFFSCQRSKPSVPRSKQASWNMPPQRKTGRDGVSPSPRRDL